MKAGANEACVTTRSNLAESQRSGRLAPICCSAVSNPAGSDDRIKTVGVAGSGTMGAGIAIVAARAGFRTIVYDTRAEALARARKQTEGFFAKSVERKKLTQDQVGQILVEPVGHDRHRRRSPPATS